MLKELAMAATFLAAAAHPAYADDEASYLWGDSALLATVKQIGVEITDQVTGSCFTNAANVKDAVELVFRRNGMEIAGEQYSDTFLVTVLGRRATSTSGANLGCSISIDAELQLGRLVTIPYGNGRQAYTAVTHWVAGTLGGGPGAQDAKIKDFAVASAEKLMNEILKSRDEIFSQHPEIKTGFEAAQ